jgi:hypothetical protein
MCIYAVSEGIRFLVDATQFCEKKKKNIPETDVTSQTFLSRIESHLELVGNVISILGRSQDRISIRILLPPHT